MKFNFRKYWPIMLAMISIFLLFLVSLPILSLLKNCQYREIDTQISDSTVNIDGQTVYYRTAGSRDKQVLVFLHGWGARLGNKCGTDGVIDALARHYYVIAPE